MPHSRDEGFTRMKAVEREYAAMRQAAVQFLAKVRQDPTIIRSDAQTRDVERASERLEGTYVIRLFAEFESGLRSYWKTVRPTQPPTKDLIDGISARHHIPTDLIGKVHDAREYRNSLVHEREDAAEPISVSECRRRLFTYFSRLPTTW
jgi:hypothetical protein